MPRNIRWDESVKENVLNLVEALLSQADDELDDLELKAAVYVEWVTQNKLRVTGKEKQKKAKREQIVEVGTRKEHLVKLVKKAGKSLKLPQRKKESGSSQLERELAEVQTALDCLRELGVFEEEKNTRKNQGYWKFTLTLKHQTATREENLEVVQQKWKEHPKTNSPVTSSTTPILEIEKSIDWHNICRTNLEKQKRLTTNRLMHPKQMQFDINQICVDLALVERKQPDKRSGDDNPECSQLYKPDYEETQKLEYEEFLATVLKASQSNKIAIIGEPGAGKTTLLQRIAFWILDNTDGLPIWIPLGNLPTPAPKLKEYLLNNWLEDAILNVTPKIRAEFEELLTAGKVWLLLDGVDEMVANSGNPLSFIDNWIPGWCQHLSMVLTCRLNVWEANPQALNNFQTYRTLEFSQEKVNEFIEACFQNRKGAKPCAPALGEQLQQALNQPGKERIKDLIRNPLRLMLLCSTWHLREGKLPDTKAELYQQFVEEVYRWKKDEFRTTPEERKQLNAKLKELALAAIDKEENRFCLRHKFVEGVLGERDGSVFQLALNIGWLNRVGVDAKNPNPNQPVYAFFHPTFQEYFAALAIKDWGFFVNHVSHNPAQGIYRIFEPQWKEIILLWLGREDVAKEQKEEFIKVLVEFEDRCQNFYGYRAFFMAAAGMVEFLDCSWADEIVGKLVKLCFGYSKKQKWQRFNRNIARGARAVLQETDRKRAITAVVNLLPTIQRKYILWQAAESLRQLNKDSPESFQALKRLVQAKDEFIRLNAAESLGKIDKGNAKVLQALIGLAQNAKHKFIRHLATAKFLVIAKDNPKALAALIELVTTSEDKFIRRQAVASLGELAKDNPDALTTLIELVQTSQIEDDEIGREAAASLGEIAKDNSNAFTALIELVQTSEDNSTCRQAVASLGELSKHNPEVLTALIELVQTYEDNSVRRQAVASLGLICGSPDALADLIWLVQNAEDSSTRRRATAILEKMAKNNPEALQALVGLVDTAKDKFICRIAAASLGKIAQYNQEALDALTRLVQTAEDKSIRWRTATSLVEIDNNHPEAIAALTRLVQADGDNSIHWLAVESLGKIAKGNSEAIAALTGLVQTAEPYIRRLAAKSLGQIGKKGDQEAICDLIELVQTAEDKSTCQEATYSLTKNIQGDGLWLAVSGLKSDLVDQVKKKNSWRYAACYDIIWHCAQNMTYPAFYQAWHPQERVEKTTTSDSQSLNQADLPQILQSAIANDPQLSQTIHLICIEGSQFIEPDRPAAEIYDQMLDQNCPECAPVPETMPALKLYWNSLKRNSDKRPVLVFYASSTEPYSEAFLTDLSKFGGAICVVTSPPTPLLQGEGSKMPSEGSKNSSGSPSSPWGEGARGWGSLQFFAPSQAIAKRCGVSGAALKELAQIADVVEWIRAS